MLPSIFEKHKICSNRTKSLLIVNQSNIIGNGVLLFDFTFHSKRL